MIEQTNDFTRYLKKENEKLLEKAKQVESALKKEIQANHEMGQALSRAKQAIRDYLNTR